MLDCQKIANIFHDCELSYFTGVPDSILKHWISYLNDHSKRFINRIAANEGAAIGHASGYYLATSKVPVVYMQNSGLGNTMNPLTSLADKDIFAIPMILLIGHRGEPGKKDAIQHKKMGEVTLPILRTLGIPYEIFDPKKAISQIKRAKNKAIKASAPVALIVKNGSFLAYADKVCNNNTLFLTREEAISVLLDNLVQNEIVVATTGKTSRELYEARQLRNQAHDRDFYMVGSMGHASAIALEIACQKPKERVFIFDGDGALIMHTGTLATIGYLSPKNLFHIVFDNSCHDSTGGQPTVSTEIDISRIIAGANYRQVYKCKTEKEIRTNLKKLKNGPSALVIKVKGGSRADLSRPTLTPKANKERFMQ